jgi:hypothetical protein
MRRGRDRWAVLAAAAGALLTAAGCLQKEVTEVWYLEPDGRVTWVVTEQDVRSDAQAAIDRQNEEADYRAAVEREDHPVARGLRLLEPLRLRTLAVRREAPFLVVTEAQFASIELLGRRLIERSGWSGTSQLTRATGVSEWTLTVRDPQTAAEADRTSEDLAALIGDLDRLRVVLTAGRFEDTSGFTLGADARVATMVAGDLDPAGNPQALILRLKWH